jgi:threonine dehydrogenase-like Zn-dependent dehydrogenase
VIAAKQLGAERIIVMSRHEARQKLAVEFNATDLVTERGDEGVARIKDMTDGLGAHSVIEAVGTQEAMTLQGPGAHVEAAKRHQTPLSQHWPVIELTRTLAGLMSLWIMPR